MIEAGVPFRDFSLDNPIRAIREVSHDLTGRRPVRLAGGRRHLAQLLGISTQAVYKWGRYVPAARVEQLRRLRPEWLAS